MSKTRVALYRRKMDHVLDGAIAAVVCHGLVKERVVPPREIDHAVERKKRFEANPAKHTYGEA